RAGAEGGGVVGPAAAAVGGRGAGEDAVDIDLDGGVGLRRAEDGDVAGLCDVVADDACVRGEAGDGRRAGRCDGVEEDGGAGGGLVAVGVGGPGGDGDGAVGEGAEVGGADGPGAAGHRRGGGDGPGAVAQRDGDGAAVRDVDGRAGDGDGALPGRVDHAVAGDRRFDGALRQVLRIAPQRDGGAGGGGIAGLVGHLRGDGDGAVGKRGDVGGRDRPLAAGNGRRGGDVGGGRVAVGEGDGDGLSVLGAGRRAGDDEGVVLGVVDDAVAGDGADGDVGRDGVDGDGVGGEVGDAGAFGIDLVRIEDVLAVG